VTLHSMAYWSNRLYTVSITGRVENREVPSLGGLGEGAEPAGAKPGSTTFGKLEYK